jgi:TfoX/Sxy family transcriptional regulator of competence genes
MSTQKGTTEFILDALGNNNLFHVRAMFGEYALYVGEKVVGLICEDQLFIKVVPESIALEVPCEKGAPYPGAKLQYIVDEDTLSTFEGFPELLIEIAHSLPERKKRKTK